MKHISFYLNCSIIRHLRLESGPIENSYLTFIITVTWQYEPFGLVTKQASFKKDYLHSVS